MRPIPVTGLFALIFIFNAAVVTVIAAIQTNFDYTGAVLKNKTGDCEEYGKPDGTVIKKCSDHERAMLKNGTEIYRYPNGTRKIRSSDGTTLNIDSDGSRQYLYPDGKKETISMDGKTPYGSLIESAEERIQIKNAVVLVFYNPACSDDILEGSARKLWDQIIIKIHARLRGNPPPGNIKRRIELSQCRFSITGYCKRMGKSGLGIVLYRNDTKYKDYTVPLSQLRKQESLMVIADSIVRTALSD